jgi:hypothetical protein
VVGDTDRVFVLDIEPVDVNDTVLVLLFDTELVEVGDTVLVFVVVNVAVDVNDTDGVVLTEPEFEILDNSDPELDNDA